MGFLDKIKDVFNPLDGVFKGVQDIIGKFKLDPELQQKFDLEITRLELNEKAKLREYERDIERAHAEDAADLRSQVKVELQSADAFVRRSRPCFTWLIIIVYFLNYGVAGVWNLFEPVTPLAIPAFFHNMAGVWMIGYGYLRSVEKVGAKPPFSK